MNQEESITKIKLISTQPEVDNIWTFRFDPAGLRWIAGQYQKYFLPQAGSTPEETEHFFTISSPPSAGYMQISTRITDSGFKKALKSLKVGDEIERKGIKGDFTWEEESDKPVVLVAGGIGVTPYHSFLLERDAQGKKLNAILLYYNRSDQIPFLKEFKELAKKHPEFKLEPVVGQPITADDILKRQPSTGQVYYLSGPEQMVDDIGDELKKRGVNLKQDWFPGYDEHSY
jgi:ferredoxin-NADP reductase